MIRDKFLPFCKPYIGEEEVEEILNTLRSGWLTTGEKSHLFEKKFAEHIHVKAALALNSCTAALHLALILLNIQPNDEIITTPFTFVSAVNVIEYVKARPVFVDIKADTMNIDPSKIEEKINKNTKAIMIVHYGGHACDMDAIINVAKKYSLPFIEDVAHGLGGAYHGKKLGTFGDFGAFSFYANKHITTGGEGGMLVSNSETFIKTARVMSLHGIDRDAWKRYREDGDWYYEVVYPGLKYNMTDLAASMGLHQLNRISSFQQRRATIAQYYNHAFANHPLLKIPSTQPKITHAWYNYPLRLNLERMSITRDKFLKELKKMNIGSSVHFIPVHLHPYYKSKYNYKETDYPIAFHTYNRLVNLPLYPALTDSDIADVVSAVKTILD